MDHPNVLASPVILSPVLFVLFGRPLRTQHGKAKENDFFFFLAKVQTASFS